MRKILFLLLAIFMIVPIAFAAQGNGNGDGNGGQENKSAGQPQLISDNETEMPPIMTNAQNQIKNQQELQQEVQNTNESFQLEIESKVKNEEKTAYKNQNEVRLAVHALLAMENVTGGIGQNVSAIAREFNNSIQATINAEIRIQERSQIVKFFIGGDEQAAAEIENQTVQNQLRIQELTQLKEQCNCSVEVQNMLQEQIQLMEQEQTRLQELAQTEKQNKGIFGWLWK